MMKRIVFVFMTAFFTMSLNAQDCAQITKNVDEFSEETTINGETKLKTQAGNHAYLSLTWKAKFGALLFFSHTSSGYDNYEVDKDDPFYIKFENGEVLEFTAWKKNYSKFSSNSTITSTSFVLRNEEIQKLFSENISKIRFSHFAGHWEYILEENYKPELKTFLECFYNSIPKE